LVVHFKLQFAGLADCSNERAATLRALGGGDGNGER
jgi:hypothetical protein